eukprot:6179851-Pleurochrysis_carterae.AAC.3
MENGIDIPNVNTIIVQDTQLFGLSQLHQLRGRRVRANLQAKGPGAQFTQECTRPRSSPVLASAQRSRAHAECPPRFAAADACFPAAILQPIRGPLVPISSAAYAAVVSAASAQRGAQIEALVALRA